MKFIDSLTINDDIITSTTVAEDDYAEWDIGTTYAVGDRVISSTTHSVYQALVGGTANDPDAERIELLNLATPDPSPQYWGYIGATRPYRMFDKQPTTVTTDPSTIVVRIDPGVSTNGVAFYGLGATSVQITVTDPTDGVIYDVTKDLTFSGEITDIWEYFTAPFLQLEAFALSDLPALYPTAYIELTFTNTAGTVTVGEVDIGPIVSLGDTLEDGTYFDRLDTSTVTTDTFGQVTDTQRPVLKISNFRSVIERSKTQITRRYLDGVRGASKRTWIGSDAATYDAIAYGYLDSGSITYEDEFVSIVKLRVIGVL